MDTPPKGLGRLYAPDDRDRLFLLQPKPEAAQVTRRTWFTRGVLDQGAKPHCVAFSGVKWLTTHPVKNKACDTTELYQECQRADEWPGEDYDGTSVRALFKVLKGRGVVSEYRWAFAAGPAIEHILTTGPLVLGTVWTSMMSQPDKHDYIYPGGVEQGGHAYLAIGADREKKNPDGTTGAVRILNSWGRDWAGDGRAFLSFDHLDYLIRHRGEAAMGTEVQA